MWQTRITTLPIAWWRSRSRRASSRIQVALSWIVNKPGVTAPIVSATKLEQLDQLVEGLSVKLTPDEIAAVEAPYVPHKVIGII